MWNPRRRRDPALGNHKELQMGELYQKMARDWKFVQVENVMERSRRSEYSKRCRILNATRAPARLRCPEHLRLPR